MIFPAAFRDILPPLPILALESIKLVVILPVLLVIFIAPPLPLFIESADKIPVLMLLAALRDIFPPLPALPWEFTEFMLILPPLVLIVIFPPFLPFNALESIRDVLIFVAAFRLIFPPCPLGELALIVPVIVLIAAPLFRLIFPEVLLVELELILAVVMLLAGADKLISPPLPLSLLVLIVPAVVLI